MKKILNNSGMSLMECIVVIVIIGIVMLIWRFTASGHVRLAVINEGHSLVDKVIEQEKLYRINNYNFLSVTSVSKSDPLKINTHQNKYFSKFSTSFAGNMLSVSAYGDSKSKAAGITVVGTYNASDNSIVFKEYGL